MVDVVVKTAAPARLSLQRLWIVVRICVCVWGSLYGLVYVLMRRLLTPLPAAHEDRELPAEIVVTLSFLVFGAIMSKERREAVHMFLGSIGHGARTAAKPASAIAAMIGETLSGNKSNIDDLLTKARASFHTLPLNVLTAEHIDGNRENADLANKNNPLSKMKTKKSLGMCDAFMSHSWTDGATPGGRDAKFRALQRWKDEFMKKEGREPTIWFDKACLEQSEDMNEVLQLLPVYLAGCRRLLILAGSTYTSRIW